MTVTKTNKPRVPEMGISNLEPYYESKLGKLYHGNCLEIMPQIEPVALVLTDIPYGKVNRKSRGLRNLNKADADKPTFNTTDFISTVINQCSGCFYVFCGTEQVSEIRAAFVAGRLSTRLGFWEKTNPSPMNGKFLWLSGIECFVYGKKPKGVHNAKCKSPVFRYATAREQRHPTQKPVGLFSEMISASTNPDSIVLDPCLGSGTMAIACERLDRKWVGIELSEKYCEIAAKRIEAEASQLKMFG